MKDKQYEHWRWRIFFITWLAYAGFYLTRASFSVAKIGIAADSTVALSSAQMGLIDGLYLTAYAAGQFFWGALGDRFGTRRIVILGLCGSIAAGFGSGVSSAVLAFGVFALLQGLSQSTGWAPLAKNLSNWFSLRERGVVMGWWATNYTIGGLIGAPFAGLAAAYFSAWSYAFIAPAIVLAIVLVLFIVLQMNRPEDVQLPPIEEYHNEPHFETEIPAENGSWQIVLDVLRNPMVLLLGGVYFFIKPIRYAILLWGPLYVYETLGSGIGESAVISVSFFIAGPFSVLVAGYVSDKLFGSRRMPWAIISVFLLAILLFVFDDLATFKDAWTIAALLFGIGFFLFGPDSLISATAAVDFGTRKGASTASGFINGMGSIGAIIGGTVPGFFKDAWGWNGVFSFLSVSVLIAGLLMLPKWNALPGDARSDA